MHGATAGPVSERDREVLRLLRDSYDMRAHTRGDSRQAGVLPEDFIDRFAVVGPPDRVTGRLRELTALGLDKLVITGAMRGVSETDAMQAKACLEAHVLPAFRA
jgi:5,10-methylenetetrahydromethanopterin reductase